MRWASALYSSSVRCLALVAFLGNLIPEAGCRTYPGIRGYLHHRRFFPHLRA